MFSVLMSLYDKEEPQNLIECLESLKLQTLKADEVIIVFDGPIKNELKKIVDSFSAELNIKKVLLKNNVGLGKALNIGLDECSYEIIARMDTDDICDKERFEKQMIFMKENQAVDMVGSSIVEFDEYGNERLKELPETNDAIKRFSVWKNPFNHMTVMFRKEKVLGVGGYKHHLFMEDYNLWLRMISSEYNLANLSEPLVKARIGSQMVKKRRGIVYIKSEIILMRVKQELKITNIWKGLFIFTVRSATRIIPSSMLSFLYNKDRMKV